MLNHTHFDYRNSRVTVKFDTTQDADDIIRDIEGCTVRSGHFCNVVEVTIVEKRTIRKSINPSPAELRHMRESA